VRGGGGGAIVGFEVYPTKGLGVSFGLGWRSLSTERRHAGATVDSGGEHWFRLRTGLTVSPLALAFSSSLTAQEEPGSSSNGPAARRFMFTVGIGNSMGWYGGQVERYFLRDRLSGFGGVGYTPKQTFDEPSGLTVAAGLRAFTSGTKHRGFVELSVSQINTISELIIEWPVTEPGDMTSHGVRFYGPGLQLGYQFVADGGFTLLASVGKGYGIGHDGYSGSFAGMIGLGLGYTWR